MTDSLGDTLARLWRTIEERRGADPASSYTARLFARGNAKIAQKLGEEAVEAVIEGVRGDRAALIGESADLFYHLFVLWEAVGVSLTDIVGELKHREGASVIGDQMGGKA